MISWFLRSREYLPRRCFNRQRMGVVSLIEDRENDFSQEIFVSPISRYSIIIGKMGGESMVAIAQGAAILGLRIRDRSSYLLDTGTRD